MFDVHLWDLVPWVGGDLGFVGHLIGWALTANYWVACQPPLRMRNIRTQRLCCNKSFASVWAFWSTLDPCLDPQNHIFLTFPMNVHP